MEPRTNDPNDTVSQLAQPECDCCQELHDERRMPRREFLTAAGGAVLGASAIGSVLPAGRVWAKAKSSRTEPAACCGEIARVAGEGAVRYALAEAAREDLLRVGLSGSEARPAADARGE